MKPETIENQTIYVGLSSLLDLRAGALFTLYGDQFFEHIVEYQNRTTDDWSKICKSWDNDVVNKLIDDKDDRVVVNTKLTNVNIMLSEMGEAFYREMAARPDLGEVRLIVSTDGWPMSPQEISQLNLIMQDTVGPMISVEVVERSLADLKPSYLADFSAVYLYDIIDWLKIHQHDLKLSPLIRTTFFSPFSLYSKSLEPEYRKLGYEELMDIASKELHPMMRMNFMSKSTFSLVAPTMTQNKEES